MCTCEIFDPPDFSDSGWRKARKGHNCVECGCVIEAGNRYHYYSSKYDGYVSTSKTCRRCWQLWEAFEKFEGQSCGYVIGSMREQVRECAGGHGKLGAAEFWAKFRAAARDVRRAA